MDRPRNTNSRYILLIDSMLVGEILAIVVMNNLEILAGDDQRVVVVLVVDNQCVPIGSSLVSLGAKNHFDVHLPIVALADLVPVFFASCLTK